MKKYYLLLALFTILLSGCGSSPEELSKIEKDSGIKIEVLSDRPFKSPNSYHYYLVRLTDKQGNTHIQLVR